MTPLPKEAIEKAREIGNQAEREGWSLKFGEFNAAMDAAERGMAWMRDWLMEPVCQTCGGTGHSWYDCADRNVPYRDSFPEDITRAEFLRRQGSA